MDIRTNLDPLNSVPAIDQKPSSSSSARPGSSATPSEQDLVTISSLSNAILATGGSSKTREAKVAELKAAVANGTYKPSADEIASAILQSPLNIHF